MIKTDMESGDKEITDLVYEYNDLSMFVKLDSFTRHWCERKSYESVKRAFNVVERFKEQKKELSSITKMRYPIDNAADVAVSSGSLEMLEFLYEKGVQCSDNGIDYAAAHGQLEILKWLIEKLNMKVTYFTLNCAIMMGKSEIVRYLLENNLSKLNKYSTALAIYYKHQDIISYLKEHIKSTL